MCLDRVLVTSRYFNSGTFSINVKEKDTEILEKANPDLYKRINYYKKNVYISNAFDKWINVWKIFSVYDKVKKMYISPYAGRDQIITTGEILEANCLPLKDKSDTTYVSGFHCFPTREEARKYKAKSSKKDCVILKVKVKNILHIGLDKDSIVFVAKHMNIS